MLYYNLLRTNFEEENATFTPISAKFEEPCTRMEFLKKKNL
jgi:hypothetical protein